jgi:hypothetical protein
VRRKANNTGEEIGSSTNNNVKTFGDGNKKLAAVNNAKRQAEAPGTATNPMTGEREANSTKHWKKIMKAHKDSAPGTVFKHPATGQHYERQEDSSWKPIPKPAPKKRAAKITPPSKPIKATGRIS